MAGIAEIWRSGKPTESGLWRKYSLKNRMKWLDCVREYHCQHLSECIELNVKAVEIDGLLINDFPSFFLVLGEAINGPGGYFGGGLDALADCLCGGFGISVPFTLIWHNHQLSKERLSVTTWPHGNIEPNKTLWAVIVEILTSRGTVLQLL